MFFRHEAGLREYRMRTRLLLAGLLGIVPVLAPAPAGAQTVAILHASTSNLPPGVEARVNGHDLRTPDINAGLRPDIDPEQRDQIRQLHLQRLVAATVIDQALEQHNLTVAPKDIDAAIADLRQNPPMLTCGCCGFSSLDDFLRANGMTEADLRLDVKRDLALAQLAQQAWTAKYPTPADEQAAVAHEGPQLAQKYRKAWQIFTNAPEVSPETPASASKSKEARAKLQKALDAIAAGKSFEDAARLYSEDASTARKGGFLGYVPIDLPLVGLIDSKRWPTLEPAKPHGPYRSWVGYHVVQIAPLTPADELELLKTTFQEKEQDRAWRQICQTANVQPPNLLDQ